MFERELRKFSPALRLAIACGRWPLDDAGRQEIRQRAAAVADWDDFLAWVTRHRIAPLVHRNLRATAAAGIPETVLERLKDAETQNLHQVLTQISEAVRIKAILDGAGIRSMMIKGPVLSLLAFGDPTARFCRDIDILVDRGRVRDAHRLITGCGYRRFDPDFELTSHREEMYLRMRWQFAYYSAETGVIQELHWRLACNPLLLPIDDAALWSRTEPIQLGGSRFLTLPDGELFLYLCVHGAAHLWFRLKWLVDVAALLGRMKPDFLERIAARARELEIERPFHQALLLAHSLLAAPVPARILTQAERSAAASRLAKAAYAALSWADSPVEPAKTRWFNTWVAWQLYRLKPGLRYRWIEFQEQLCDPEDWARVPLPESLSFLYLPLRPVSWAARKLMGAFAH